MNEPVAHLDPVNFDQAQTGHDTAGFKMPRVTPARWPRLMNRDGVAEYLSVSVRHVDVLVKQGLIPSARFRPSTRLVRWDKEEIDASLDRREQAKARGGKSFDEVMAVPPVALVAGQRGGR